MNTTRHKQVVTMTLSRDVVDRLKAWIAKQDIRHPQNAVVEKAITKFLDEHETNGEKS
jgi:hypothetical protein